MSSITTFVPLTKLRPFKGNWRVQVKCLNSWKATTPYAGDTFEMVLADQWVSFGTLPFFHSITKAITLSNMSLYFF